MRRLFIILLLCALPVFHVFAQTTDQDPLAECGHDPTALATAIEANGWSLDDLIQINWSPNCRYLSLRLPSSHGKPGTTIVWDADTNQQVGTIVGFSTSGGRVGWWDASGDYLLAAVKDVGTYLWYVPANRVMLIDDYFCGVTNTYWDYEHHKLYGTTPARETENGCSPYIYAGGLRVYDLDTGATLARYPVHGYVLAYEFAGEGRYLVITNSYGPVQVYDTTTGQQVAKVKIDEGGGVIMALNDVELSPDAHYLAVGRRYLRVWDLTTLPNDLDAQQPTYRYAGPLEYIESLRFTDNQTIETTTWKGTQVWDVTTGAQIR